MSRENCAGLFWAACLLAAVLPLHATTVGPGETVTDTSAAGQNVNIDGALTYHAGAGMNYDTGAGLLGLSGSFTRSLGTGATQIQWQGSGGFTADSFRIINLGNQATPATLTWGSGGFVPTGSALVLGSNIRFDNSIDLGTDPTATRQIDIGVGYPQFNGAITGSGNLLLQAYGAGSPHRVTFLNAGNSTTGPGTINITGTATLNNVDLFFKTVGSPSFTAAAFVLTNGAVVTSVGGSPDVTLSGGSSFVVSPAYGGVTNQSTNRLDSIDPTSYVGLGNTLTSGPTVVAETASLTVHSGYFAGQIQDSSSLATSQAGYPAHGGSLIKDGTGIFTLAGDSSSYLHTSAQSSLGYTQGTTVKQGTLLVANTTGTATGSGQVVVMNGGKLGGTGTIAPYGAGQNITVQSGGAVDLTAYDPAHAPTLLTNTLTFRLSGTNTATFASGATLAFDLGAGGASDTLAFAGLTLNGSQVAFNSNQVNFNLLTGAGPGTYTLFTFDQAGSYSGTLTNSLGDIFHYNPTSITLEVPASIPEPATWLLLLAGGLLLAFARGRRASPPLIP